MKIKTESQKAFTLVELIMAISAGLIVVLAAGMVVVLGQTSWNDAWKKVNLQRDASYAMLTMSQSIKSATSAASDVDGPVLSLNNNSIIFSYVQATGDLQCQIGGQTQTILDGKVQSLQFNVDDANDTVTIDLDLLDNNVQTNFVSTVLMRNSGG